MRHHATPSLKNRPAAEGRGKGLWDKIKSGGERISRSANKLARDEKYLPFLKLDSEQFSTNRRRLPGIRCRGRPFKTQPLSKGVDSLPLPQAFIRFLTFETRIDGSGEETRGRRSLLPPLSRFLSFSLSDNAAGTIPLGNRLLSRLQTLQLTNSRNLFHRAVAELRE